MQNRNTDFCSELTENGSVNPRENHQNGREAQQEVSKETSNHNKKNMRTRTANLFNFSAVGVFVKDQAHEASPTRLKNCQKNFHSDKSNDYSVKKDLNNSLNNLESVAQVQQEPSLGTSRDKNEGTGPQIVPISKLRMEFRSILQDYSETAERQSKSSLEFGDQARLEALEGGVLFSQCNNQKKGNIIENDNEESKRKNETVEKNQIFQPLRRESVEKRVPVPIASKMVKSNVIEGIKSKVASTTNSKNGTNGEQPPSLWKNFRTELKLSNRRDTKSGFGSQELEDDNQCEKKQIASTGEDDYFRYYGLYAENTDSIKEQKRALKRPFKLIQQKDDLSPDAEEEDYYNEEEGADIELQSKIFKLIDEDEQEISPKNMKFDQNFADQKSTTDESNFHSAASLQEIHENFSQIHASDLQNWPLSYRSRESSTSVGAIATTHEHGTDNRTYTPKNKKNLDKNRFQLQVEEDSEYQYQSQERRYDHRVKSLSSTVQKNYFSPRPAVSYSKSLTTLEGNIIDRSFKNEDFTTAHSNLSTPKSQDHAPLTLQPSQKIHPEGLSLNSPTYMIPHHHTFQQPTYQNFLLGFRQENLGVVNYTESSNDYLRSAGKNSKWIPEEEQGTELYEINLDKIEANPKTTIMIKNIPNKYGKELMMQDINRNNRGTYDFFYLPIDFKHRCNVGYAFINFIEPKHIRNFYLEFNGSKWERFKSEKICLIKYARIQGLRALKQHFRSSIVMNQQDPGLRPWILEDEIEQQQQQFLSQSNDFQPDYVIKRPMGEAVMRKQKPYYQNQKRT